jgi:hypothetical protein
MNAEQNGGVIAASSCNLGIGFFRVGFMFFFQLRPKNIIFLWFCSLRLKNRLKEG